MNIKLSIICPPIFFKAFRALHCCLVSSFYLFLPFEGTRLTLLLQINDTPVLNMDAYDPI